MGRTYEIVPERYWTVFGRNEPAARAASGDTITLNTRDAWGFDEQNQPLPDPEWSKGHEPDVLRCNPLIGPIYVEGTEPGDTLAVRIEDIVLNRPSAWSALHARFGSLTGEGLNRSMLLNEPLELVVYNWRLDLERMTGTLSLDKSSVREVTIPLDPFIGSIGVAPRFGRVESSLVPGEYGGNMDTPETRKGATIFLPVSATGAYLYLGDIHAAQGDGEMCGAALETTAKVTIGLEVIKKNIDWPRLKDRDFIMTVGSTRPLEDAIGIAAFELVKWLVDEYGFDKWEAWQVISQVASIRIGNICDPNYTAVLKYPKKYLDKH